MKLPRWRERGKRVSEGGAKTAPERAEFFITRGPHTLVTPRELPPISLANGRVTLRRTASSRKSVSGAAHASLTKAMRRPTSRSGRRPGAAGSGPLSSDQA